MEKTHDATLAYIAKLERERDRAVAMLRDCSDYIPYRERPVLFDSVRAFLQEIGK